MPSLPLDIRRITASDTMHLRHKVLWPSIPLESQLLPLDTHADSIHLGAFLPDVDSGTVAELRALGVEEMYLPAADASQSSPQATASPPSSSPSSTSPSRGQQPLACLSIYVEPYLPPLPPSIPTSVAGRQMQLHKFAVHPALQGRGVGRRLLAAAVPAVAAQLGASPDAPVLLHLDAREGQVGFYTACGMGVLDEEVFAKRGPTGDGPVVWHVRMGRVLE